MLILFFVLAMLDKRLQCSFDQFLLAFQRLIMKAERQTDSEAPNFSKCFEFKYQSINCLISSKEYFLSLFLAKPPSLPQSISGSKFQLLKYSITSKIP
jgi:hypothetical protein